MKYVVKIDKTLFHYFTFSPFWQKVPPYVIVLVIDSLKVFRTLSQATLDKKWTIENKKLSISSVFKKLYRDKSYFLVEWIFDNLNLKHCLHTCFIHTTIIRPWAGRPVTTTPATRTAAMWTWTSESWTRSRRRWRRKGRNRGRRQCTGVTIQTRKRSWTATTRSWSPPTCGPASPARSPTSRTSDTAPAAGTSVVVGWRNMTGRKRRKRRTEGRSLSPQK